MNAIELLKTQHREVEKLFDQCEQAEGMQRQMLFDQIADMLAVHATIEEQHFYPAVMSGQTEELLKDAVEEHFEVKQLIAEMIDLGVDGEGFDSKLMSLKEAVSHHVHDEEEPELFPLAEQILDADVLEALGDTMTETMVTLESEGEPRQQVFSELDQPATI